MYFSLLLWQDQVTKAWAESGYRAVPLEILLNPEYMDILSPKGFVLGLLIALKCKTMRSFAMLATVCSTWVFMNRGTSGRSIWRPMGDYWKPSVKAANIMVSRMVLLKYILEAKRVFWMLEQPVSSIQTEHFRLQEFAANMVSAGTPLRRAFTWMGAFNAETAKGSVLYSTRPDVSKFARELPGSFVANKHDVFRSSVDKNGRTRVSGGADLKSTQGYTHEFGRATVEVFESSLRVDLRPITRAAPTDIFCQCSGRDNWEDANIVEVKQFLTGGACLV